MTTENYMGSDSYQGQNVWGNIKNRFIIVTILSILVSSALSSLYNVDKSTTDMSYLAIMTPVFFILAYTAFEIFKKKLNSFYLTIISRELLAGILSFVFPLTFVAFFKTVAGLGFIMKAILFVAIWGVPFVAIATFVTTIVTGVLAYKNRE